MDQIRSGYTALKKIENCINKNQFGDELVRACDAFYTRIPHNFGSVHKGLISSALVITSFPYHPGNEASELHVDYPIPSPCHHNNVLLTLLTTVALVWRLGIRLYLQTEDITNTVNVLKLLKQ